MVPEFSHEQLTCADKDVGMVEEVGFYHGLQIVVTFVAAVQQSGVVKLWKIRRGRVNGGGVGLRDDNGGVIGFAETFKRVG